MINEVDGMVEISDDVSETVTIDFDGTDLDFDMLFPSFELLDIVVLEPELEPELDPLFDDLD
jgi:hypothetical protein